ncbi:MAG TPA: FtsW/RodA/SpoVE family cell cycle protein [Pirellulales bacterium]|nr:FtsW/RodA/SpoVE family cell cycle protein [Pirellulales bacterium]
MDGLLVVRRRVWPIAAVALVLLILGCATIARCEQINDGSNRLVRQQIVWSILGFGALILTSWIDYRRFARYIPIFYGATLIGLLAVYFFPPVNGAHRWIRVGGFGIQPSELAKVVFILSLAQWLMYYDAAAGFAGSVLWPLAMTGLPMLLILKEPDLGTALVFLPILFSVLFAAGARRRDLLRLAVAGLLLFPLLWSQMSHDQRSRVTALWEQNAPREQATADGFHLDQAKRMFALGGTWGSIFRSEADKQAVASSRLPEAQTDSVFCVVGERFGLIGIGLLLVLFGVLAAKCLSVASHTEESFGRLIAVGVAALFGAEVLINTGMMVGLLPITGLALPLISYGGSDLVAHMGALGLVMSVARHSAR